MLQVRQGVFETNSSSTHTLNICTQEEFDAWTAKDSDICFVGDAWGDFGPSKFNGAKFVTKQEVLDRAIEANKEHENEEHGRYYRPYDIEHFFEQPEDKWYLESDAVDNNVYLSKDYESDTLEYYESKFTTPSGDKMIAFGMYGQDY